MRTIAIIFITLAFAAAGLFAFWQFYLKKKLQTILASQSSQASSYNPAVLVQTGWGDIVVNSQVIGSAIGNGLFRDHQTGKVFSMLNGKQV